MTEPRRQAAVSADIVAQEYEFIHQPLTNAEIWNTMKV